MKTKTENNIWKGRFKNTTFIGVIFVFLFIVSSSVAPVLAQPPYTLNHHGSLRDADGKAVDGSADITFRLYEQHDSGEPIWSEMISDVVVHHGRFSVELGNQTPLNGLAFDKQYYLGVEVNSDGEMEPRSPLTSVLYAIRSILDSDTLRELSCAKNQFVRFNGDAWECFSASFPDKIHSHSGELPEQPMVCENFQKGTSWMLAVDDCVGKLNTPRPYEGCSVKTEHYMQPYSKSNWGCLQTLMGSNDDGNTDVYLRTWRQDDSGWGVWKLINDVTTTGCRAGDCG